MSYQKNSFSKNIIHFLLHLNTDIKLPRGVEILNPFAQSEVPKLVNKYYKKYYLKGEKRIFIFGINPGRLGSGITGISFTDPVNLLNDDGIRHSLPMKSELSSQFIHEMFKAYGGLNEFAKDFFLTSISPLGFIANGKNLNYYDTPEMQKKLKTFIVENMHLQIKCGAYSHIAICLGEGQNLKYFKTLNDEFKWFDRIIPLPHPRFVMQYKRKEKEKYINRYLETLIFAKNLLKIR